jgi:hypothetical protein
MKALALAACLFASTAFAQEIIISGNFPPRSSEDIEIALPEGWGQWRLDDIFSQDSQYPTDAVQLWYRDDKGKVHDIWIFFGKEREE